MKKKQPGNREKMNEKPLSIFMKLKKNLNKRNKHKSIESINIENNSIYKILRTMTQKR